MTCTKLGDFEEKKRERIDSIRVTRGRSNPILYLSLRVVERAEVLPDILETSGDLRDFVTSFL